MEYQVCTMLTKKSSRLELDVISLSRKWQSRMADSLLHRLLAKAHLSWRTTSDSVPHTQLPKLPYPTSLQSEFPTMPMPFHAKSMDCYFPVAMLQRRQCPWQKLRSAASKAISQSLRRPWHQWILLLGELPLVVLHQMLNCDLWWIQCARTRCRPGAAACLDKLEHLGYPVRWFHVEQRRLDSSSFCVHSIVASSPKIKDD